MQWLDDEGAKVQYAIHVTDLDISYVERAWVWRFHDKNHRGWIDFPSVCRRTRANVSLVGGYLCQCLQYSNQHGNGV